ncbi:MAG TPA: phage/plasmid primase, P4 family [Bradyrhizobium sp.]
MTETPKSTETVAVDFLEWLRPGGPWVLTAIIPDGKTVTITARNADEVRRFVRANDGKKNIYYSVNPTRTAMTRKASKVDIAAIEYLLSDLDPRDGETTEAAKARYLAALETHEPTATAIVDSGNGTQRLWRLAKRIELPEPVTIKNAKGEKERRLVPEAAAIIADVEARSAALMVRLGGTAGTQNIDRILRLPGTTNLPNRKKVKAGRVACPTRLIRFNCATCSLDAFPPVAAPQARQPKKAASLPPDPLPVVDVETIDLSVLDDEASTRLRTLIKTGTAPDLHHGSRSETVLHVVCELIRADVSDAIILALVLDRRYRISDHIYDQEYPQRYAARQLTRALEMQPRPGPIVSDEDHRARAVAVRKLCRPHLLYYREDYLDFEDGAYRIVADHVIETNTRNFLDRARARRPSSRRKDAVLRVVSFLPDIAAIRETLAALRAVAHLDPLVEMPCWLDGREGPPPCELIAFPNGLLDLRDRKLHPVDAAFFTTAALGFDYQPPGEEPKTWLKFLDEIFDGDKKQIDMLQEVFGYLLTGEVSLEKAFLFLGPARSGKGTILGMLRNLLASTAVAGPTLHSLSTNFGLAPLIGKQLAIIDDLRVGTRAEQSALIENVLKITGRGLFTIDRKFKDSWSGTLPVKLVLISNLMPKLGDDSGAIASRFIILVTRVSFFDREDPRLLENKLLPELGGVLHWSLDGLRRLRKRGHFDETTVSREARERLANLGSSAMAFIAEECELGADYHATKDALYEAWKLYAEANDVYPGTKEKFCEALYAATGGRVRHGKPISRGKQVPSCMGIRLVPNAAVALREEREKRDEARAAKFI